MVGGGVPNIFLIGMWLVEGVPNNFLIGMWLVEGVPNNFLLGMWLVEGVPNNFLIGMLLVEGVPASGRSWEKEACSKAKLRGTVNYSKKPKNRTRVLGRKFTA